MRISSAAYVTLFAPLVGALVIMVMGMRLPTRIAGVIGSASVLASFAGAVTTWASWGERDHGLLLTPYTWLTSGSFKVGFDLWIDPLSILEMLVVSGVGFLIHAYSIGYMHGDPQKRRFFAYMNIFTFSMLMLVMAGNFVFLLIGWGLVGMASYLLIGFWHERTTAVAAAKKAFIINAIGDVGIMLALFMIFVRVGAIDYPTVFKALPGAVTEDSRSAALIGGLLLLGALAKSAQLPLHTWLPDAMEGPTPVSALIHAATMVTAGVYLIARMHPVYDLTSQVQLLIALLGAGTLVLAGFIALSQTDIKRVIAYSTMSQIGYMITAAGIGAYGAAMFHLTTHAFFKALLFLGAGIIIHALHDEQDIRKMGGLKKYMPQTYRLFLIGTLALAGVIPFAGFFSKDEILAFLFASGEVYGPFGYVIWGMGLFGAVLTGLYSFRLFWRVFHGEPGEATLKLAKEGLHHGEGPRTMMVPVWILGALTVLGGLLVVPGAWNIVGDWLHRAEAAPVRHALHEAEPGTAAIWALALLVSLPLALLGIWAATRIWGENPSWAGARDAMPSADRLLQAQLGFDELYDSAISAPTRALANLLGNSCEKNVMGGAMMVAVRTTTLGSVLASRMQSGMLRSYALGLVASTLIAIVAILTVEVR